MIARLAMVKELKRRGFINSLGAEEEEEEAGKEVIEEEEEDCNMEEESGLTTRVYFCTYLKEELRDEEQS